MLNFGRHAGRYYSDVLRNETNYCRWVVRASQQETSSSEAFSTFAEFCRDRLPEDAGDDEVDGDALVGFGKYAGLTRAELLPKDPDYCAWVAKSCRDDSSPNFKGLATFVKAQAAAGLLPTPASDVVRFGKHKGASFEDVLRADPEYCQWVVDQAHDDGSERNPEFLQFAEYLQQQGVTHHLQHQDTSGPQEQETAQEQETVGVGQYKQYTFQQMRHADLTYCQFLVGLAQQEDASPGVKRAAAKLQELYPEDFCMTEEEKWFYT